MVECTFDRVSDVRRDPLAVVFTGEFDAERDLVHGPSSARSTGPTACQPRAFFCEVVGRNWWGTRSVCRYERMGQLDELAAQGRATTAHIAAGVGEVVDRNRRRRKAVCDKTFGRLPLRVLMRVPTSLVVVPWRKPNSAQLAAVVDELETVHRRQHDELRETLAVAAERQLSVQTLLTQAVAEVAGLCRAQHDAVSATLDVVMERELTTQMLVTQAIDAVGALGRQQHDESREVLQCTAQELEALARITDAITRAVDLSTRHHDEVHESLNDVARQQQHSLGLVTDAIEALLASNLPSRTAIRDTTEQAMRQELQALSSGTEGAHADSQDRPTLSD